MLTFKGYDSINNNGKYKSLIDSGSNTPAMRTEFVKQQGFPIYAVKRPFTADTANSVVILQYATILELENTNNDGDKYWMKTIFYLLDNVSVDIIVDRRLMRFPGFDICLY